MATPEQMREAVAAYVHEIHRSYVDQAALFPPAVRGRMALLGEAPFTVAAVGARNLHLLATTEALGPPRDPEVVLDASYGGCRWQLRFFDPVVLPVLGLLDETETPAYAQVRHALGVGTVIYHVVAHPGAGLSAHQATHVGAGLANAHSATARDFETIRARLAGREELVDELAAAWSAGLRRAQALLARAILPYDEAVRAACEAEHPDPDAIRKALLARAGGRTQWTPPGVAS
jgi:hypothetical protein